MKEEKKESPIGVLWGWGKPYHGKFIGSVIYTKPHRQALALNAGIINRFRISNVIDIHLELSAMGAEDKFDGTVAGKGFCGTEASLCERQIF